MHALDAIKQHACAPDTAALQTAVAAARSGDEDARARLCGALLWAGCAAPDAIMPVYDTICAAWLEQHVAAEPLPATAAVPLPDAFWTAFTALMDDAPAGFDAGTITARVAALAGVVDAGYGALAEAHARRHPGAADAASRPVPGRIEQATLAACPADSLGGELYRMIVDNGYDLEVLDREAINLAQLSPALRFLNTRILQMHDVWHLVGGYTTSASHEIAISAFQLAQFGHNYSAMFLASVACITHVHSPAGFGVIMQLVAEAWQHGRATPSFMAIDWEDEMPRSLADIRSRHGIETYRSALPSELFEQLQVSSAAG